MIIVEKIITCVRCGQLEGINTCEQPEDSMESLCCATSDKLLKESICDKCRSIDQNNWLNRTQRFETSEEMFLIPDEHSSYDKSRVSPNGLLLAKGIFANIDNNLYVSGEYDLGKTKACCAALVWLKREKGLRIAYIAFNEIMNKYSTLAVEQSKQKADDFLKSLLKYDYLIIDDFCKKRLTYSNCEATYQLSEYIYTHDHKCKIWITANFGYSKALEKWDDKDLGRATFSRFVRCGFKEWSGQDNRFI
jgi:DNA replication protein DnaC